MELFESLFGIKAEEVRSSCIIMPFVPHWLLKEFNIEKFSRGILYSSGNSKLFTVFYSRSGCVFTGDAVLYLSETRCRELYFLGTCGLLQKISGVTIGSIVSPSSYYAQESFVSLLSDSAPLGMIIKPDPILHNTVMDAGEGLIVDVTGISAGSLKLQPELKAQWAEAGVQVVDLEVAAFLAAAQNIERPATALMVISDIVKEKPWHQRKDQELIKTALKKAGRILCEIIFKRQRD